VPEPLPELLEHALPTTDFDASLKALLAAEVDERPADAEGAPVGERESWESPALESPTWESPTREPEIAESEPREPEAPSTAAAPLASTLTRRVPGATTEALPEPRMEPPVRRSPDDVRALLSRYRSGLEAGRQTDDPSQEVST
jgi:hypothetical protein